MKGENAISSAKEIAKYFLAKQDREAGEVMTLLKLQKLLYYAQGIHLALYGRPLFRETVEAWDHGPVVREVWDEYRAYRGARAIPIGVAPALSEDAIRVLEQVQAAYGQFAAGKLRDMTHREAPWLDARQAEGTISEESMETFFRAQLLSPSRARQTWAEALRNPRFKAAVDEGLADLAAGRTVPWSEVEQSLPSV